MDDIQTFVNPDFGTFRILMIESEPWFVGKDVASVLGYTNPTKAMQDHIDAEDMTFNESLKLSRQSGAWLINESGLYSLILSSKLPSAKRFKHWVTAEVLPSIRKHGAYMTDDTLEKALLSPDFLIQLANQLKDERAKRQELERINAEQTQQLREAEPLARFAKAVQASETSILVRDMAKMLKQNGLDTGEKRFYTWLRDNGYLSKCGSSYNMPTQYSMNLNLFEVKETVITHSDGHTSIRRTPMVTGKGQTYFIERLSKSRNGKVLIL